MDHSVSDNNKSTPNIKNSASSDTIAHSTKTGMILPTLLITAIYVAAAMVGLLPEMPSGYISTFMPATGFALAAILMCGTRCWPGIWSGGFLVYFWLDISLSGAWVAALLATGVTLQAILAARLTQRFLSDTLPLSREPDVWSFLLLSGPLACLVSATISVSVLSSLDRLPASAFQAHWLQWWTGDTLGTLLFTPLVLLAWPGTGNLWQNRCGRIAVPLLITAAALAAGQWGFARLEATEAEIVMHHSMDDIYGDSTDHLPAIIEPLHVLGGLFTASNQVTREEYVLFTNRVIEQPSIDSVDWAPRVPAAERTAFEQVQRGEGRTSYRIFQLDKDNHPTDIDNRAEYFPVALTVPMASNADLLGLDHGFEEPRRQAMAQAVASGDIVSAQCVHCLFAPRRTKLLAFKPVFEAGFDVKTATQADRWASLMGFIVGGINIEKLFAPLAQKADRQQIAFRITDITPGYQPRVLAGTLLAGTFADWSRQVTFANRSLLIEMDPIHGYWNHAATLESGLFFVFSVAAVIFIVFSVLSIAGRTVAEEVLVAAHTIELESELSARRVAEAALRKSESDLEITLNSIGDAVLATDADGRITRMNPVAEKLTGWSVPDALGQPIGKILHIINEETRQPLSTPASEVLRTGTTQYMTNHTVIIGRNGLEHHIADSAAPIRDEDGSVRGVVLVFRDVGKERQAEQALQASEARYRQFIESSPLGIMVVCGNNFVFMNPMAATLLGADSPEQLLGKPVLDYIDSKDHDAVRERIRLLYIEQQSVPAQEQTWYRLDGTQFRGQTRSVPYRHENQPAALVFLLDVTARREAEAALIQARLEAELANRAKSAFLATMSHEIRTPMNGVIGMVEILAQSRLSSHQKDTVNTIRESAATLLQIIDDILDFSKIEAGRLELDTAPVCVADIVEGLCNSLVAVAESKGVELSLFIAPELPKRLLADGLRLRQVLYNLIGNAIKFSAGIEGHTGQVSVRVEIAARDPFNLSFQIADNGIGMKPETLKGLFTPFTQAEVSTTRRFGGTGLGLVICKRLVELMQGKINAESVFGEGSVFTATLPLEVIDEQPQSLDTSLAGLDCILVDNPKLHPADLRAYLEHAGARVTVADSIDSAVQSAADRKETVVVVHYAGRQNPLVDTVAGSSANIRHLALTQGRRRGARAEKDNLVSLDANALRRDTLLRAVAVAAGLESPEIFYDQNEDYLILEDNCRLPTVAEARAQDRLILIAEDDEINQHVILQQLRLLGYVGEVATNGAEALQLWRKENYALLLTDLHMPEMDGYTLAQAIRNEEQDARRIPIIALTANALRGEEERATAAGMDAYLTKPASLQLLRATLEKWLPRPVLQINGPVPEPEEVDTVDTQLVDINVLKQMVGDEREIIEEFLVEYLDSARKLTGEIQAAFEAGDTRHVSALAHRLKSSSRSVGALVLGDLCAGLENAAKEGNKNYTSQQVQELKTTLAAVEGEIHAILTEQGWNSRDNR